VTEVPQTFSQRDAIQRPQRRRRRRTFIVVSRSALLLLLLLLRLMMIMMAWSGSDGGPVTARYHCDAVAVSTMTFEVPRLRTLPHTHTHTHAPYSTKESIKLHVCSDFYKKNKLTMFMFSLVLHYALIFSLDPLLGPFHGAIAVPSVTRCRCRRRCRCREHR